jgi:hypothetical protein
MLVSPSVKSSDQKSAPDDVVIDYRRRLFELLIVFCVTPNRYSGRAQWFLRYIP